MQKFYTHNQLATTAQEMVINKDNQRASIKAKMEVNIEKNKYFKLINFKNN
jgi:hypothetical protein